MIDIEIWKPTFVYSDYYEVSNFGNVRGVPRIIHNRPNQKGNVFLKSRVLKQGLNAKGYPVVYLSKKGKQRTVSVHRLVAIAFIKKECDKPQVNHRDGNKINNNVSNLEWCNNSENQLHAYKLGLNVSSPKAGRPKKAVRMLKLNTDIVLSQFNSLAEASKVTGVNQYNIRSVCEGLRKKAGGYNWEYRKEVMPNE